MAKDVSEERINGKGLINTMKSRALDGIKIVEYANFVSGPYCGKLLAGFGAEVIKVEPPGTGDEAREYGPFFNDVPDPEQSGLYLYLNTNKSGITLNVNTPTGCDIICQLLKDADIFIENNSPPLMKRLGLDYDTIRTINPRLIVTSITPFGQSGPYKDYKAFALNCCAAGGVSMTVGEPSREPLSAPLSMSHYMAGVSAATATLIALIARGTTGKGQQVDISEVQCWSLAQTGLMVSGYVYHGMKKKRGGFRTPGGTYPMGVVPCKDGYLWMIAIQGHQWKRFLKIIGGGEVPEWYANDPRFNNRREAMLKYADELDARLGPWLMAHTRDEILQLCRHERIPFMPVKMIDEVVDSRQFNERGYFIQINHARAGVLKYPGYPFRMSETPATVFSAAPLLGEHNQDIYCRRLGFSKEEMVKLRRGVII